MRFIVYIGLLLSLLGALEHSLATPEKAVKSYYYAMNHADIELLKKVMVKDSYDETIQIYALSIALKDNAFHAVLKQYGSNQKINGQVEEAVRIKLQNSPPKLISDLVTQALGKSRAIVRYKENGNKKQLYTSIYGAEWKIDYMAGRQID